MMSHWVSGRSPSHQIGGYRAWPCASTHDQAFDLLWISRAAATPLAHRVLPNGEPSIAVRRRRATNGDLAEVDIVVCAVYDIAFWYRPKPAEELIALRLKPELSAALLGVDACEYRNTEPTPAPRRLAARMSATLRVAENGGVGEVAAALIGDMTRASNANFNGSSIACSAPAAIRSAQGRVGVRFLAQEFGVSERHLRRVFRNAVGCSPKTYARRARLTAAAIAADASDEPDWAQIALETGFHDQAHMIGEYRALIGQTPGRNHRERRGGSVFSNTAALA